MTAVFYGLTTYLFSQQRIATSTREGGPNGINLAQYMEALHDQEACLTYTALTGERKQSVSDAEHLFSPSLLAFMEHKGYTCEANYIRVVLNWRQTCGERGLNELQRSHFNQKMLNYISGELMLWHQDYDYSYLEVNRYNIYTCICISMQVSFGLFIWLWLGGCCLTFLSLVVRLCTCANSVYQAAIPLF